MTQQLIALTTMVIVGLGLINSVHAFDPQHIVDASKKGASYTTSLTSIFYACVDLTKAQDIPMLEKCGALMDKYNVAMEEVFTASKADMDEIMRKAIDSKVTGGFDSSVPQYNYGPSSLQEYRN